MIKFLAAGPRAAKTKPRAISGPRAVEKYKVARTRVPRTAEFRPYSEARADREKSRLIDAAATALGRVADGHPDATRTGLRPDDLYETVMDEHDLRGDWERAFDGERNGRDMFGLVAWTHFFDRDATWLAKPSPTPGLGKRGWTYLAEAAAPEAPPALAEAAAPEAPPAPPAPAAVFEIGRCVRKKATGECGRVVGVDGPASDRFYWVRLPRRFDEPWPEELVADVDLSDNEDDAPCRGIPSNPRS
jgi:hypothetical protein